MMRLLILLLADDRFTCVCRHESDGSVKHDEKRAMTVTSSVYGTCVTTSNSAIGERISCRYSAPPARSLNRGEFGILLIG